MSGVVVQDFTIIDIGVSAVSGITDEVAGEVYMRVEGQDAAWMFVENIYPDWIP